MAGKKQGSFNINNIIKTIKDTVTKVVANGMPRFASAPLPPPSPPPPSPTPSMSPQKIAEQYQSGKITADQANSMLSKQAVIKSPTMPTATPTPQANHQGFVQGTPDDLKDMISNVANKYQVPTNLFSAMLKKESNFNQNAKSPVGARGIGQLMPDTAKALGVDVNSLEGNMEGAAKYLKQQYDRFGNWETALAAYNAGPNAVNQYGGIPPYEETQNYVKVITQDASNNVEAAPQGNNNQQSFVRPQNKSYGSGQREMLDLLASTNAQLEGTQAGLNAMNKPLADVSNTINQGQQVLAQNRLNPDQEAKLAYYKQNPPQMPQNPLLASNNRMPNTLTTAQQPKPSQYPYQDVPKQSQQGPPTFDPATQQMVYAYNNQQKRPVNLEDPRRRRIPTPEASVITSSLGLNV